MKEDFRIDAWHIQPRLHRITGFGKTTQVPRKYMQVLLYLAGRPDEVVPREELLENVWPDLIVTDVSLTRAISELRKIFGDDARHPQIIETIPSVGYRLIAPISPPGSLPRENPAAAETQGRAGAPWRHAPRLVSGIVVVLVVSAIVLLAGLIWHPFDGTASTLKAVPLTSYPGLEVAPALSSDGHRVAFAWDGGSDEPSSIYVKLLDEETPLRLTAAPAHDLSPTWSPDDQYVAFIRKAAQGCGLYTVPAIGGPARKLATCPTGDVVDLDWSPDGAVLAFADRPGANAPTSLYLLSTETLDVQRLTQPPPSSQGDNHPAFSPDGTTLAFTRTRVPGLEDLYVMDVDGGSLRRLTLDSQRILSVAWADAHSLLYASDRDGSFGLWRMPAGGGTPRKVLAGGDGLTHATLAPRTRALVYEQRRMDKNIWRLPLETARRSSAPEPLIASTRWDWSPDFSPDGTRIAFASNRSGRPEIWITDRDGSRPVRLTTTGAAGLLGPRWSPDGRHLAFEARTDGQADLYLVAADGGAPQRLTSDPADDVVPSWSRDGRWIYFASNRSGRWQVWKRPFAGGEGVQVTRNGGFAAFETYDGQTLYFTRRDRPGLWRQAAAGGEETLVLDRLHPNFWRNWAVTRDGLYFIDRAAATLAYLDFATEAITPIATRMHLANPGLAVSPEGSGLLYVQVDRNESDLMLVRDFR